MSVGRRDEDSGRGDQSVSRPSVPLIIGHRGASGVAPENTVTAFERALADGADGLEFDVRLARDGVPVVIHDATLRRTVRRNGRIAALTSAELCEMDAGTWFNLRHPTNARAEYAEARIPTLAQVFEAVAARCRVLYVEMKCEGAETGALAAEVVRLVREHTLIERVVVESFALDAVKEVKRIGQDIRTAALFDRQLARPFPTMRAIIRRATDCGADEIALHRSLVTRRLVEAARREGMNALVWTVDHPSWIRRAIAVGLCAIITNHPARMCAALEEIHA